MRTIALGQEMIKTGALGQEMYVLIECKHKRGIIFYPFGSTTCLEIFIFLVDPVYNSSRSQGNILSTGGGFLSPSPYPKGLVPKNSANMSSAFRGLNLSGFSAEPGAGPSLRPSSPY